MEIFVDAQKTPNKFDYIEWRRWYFDSKSPEEIDRETEEYARTHPFHGDKAVII